MSSPAERSDSERPSPSTNSFPPLQSLRSLARQGKGRCPPRHSFDDGPERAGPSYNSYANARHEFYPRIPSLGYPSDDEPDHTDHEPTQGLLGSPLQNTGSPPDPDSPIEYQFYPNPEPPSRRRRPTLNDLLNPLPTESPPPVTNPPSASNLPPTINPPPAAGPSSLINPSPVINPMPIFDPSSSTRVDARATVRHITERDLNNLDYKVLLRLARARGVVARSKKKHILLQRFLRMFPDKSGGVPIYAGENFDEDTQRASGSAHPHNLRSRARIPQQGQRHERSGQPY